MEKEFAFQWHITNSCNLRCKHCYQEEFDREKDLSPNLLEKIIRDIIGVLKENNYSSLSINITGGEPLISPLLFPVLNILEKEDFVKDFSIITNGEYLGKMQDKLALYRKLKYLKISLEGAKEESNDYIRGRGNFNRVVEILKECKLKKVLMFTLAKYNYKEIYEMIKLTNKIGGIGLILERFIPLGKGREIIKETLGMKEWFEVCSFISEIYGLSPYSLLPYKAFYINIKDNEIYGALCNLGDESMCLMPDGIVFPCRRLPIEIGDLRKESFSNVLLRLRKFRNLLNKKNLEGICSSCNIKNCIGCRALSYALSKNLFKEDIQCFYLKL
ncbi:MAG: radical SAM protein [Dictyoglomus sp.]|nr:radical SAM protein [Dictyoglomus sp.]MDW8187916.1 radical SAM protein [Dictyoglomus sp.]